MRGRMAERRLLIVLGTLALALLVSSALGLHGGSANAGPLPPANDDFANAVVVPEPLPFSHAADPTDASLEPGEPDGSIPDSPCANGVVGGNTVWYSFTPGSDLVVTADTFGSDIQASLVPYSGSSLSSLEPVACRSPFISGIQEEVIFTARKGVTYSIQVGPVVPPSGNLVFNLTAKPPPAKGNDDFANSISVPFPLSFTNTQDVRGSTFEVGERQPCVSVERSVWYSFTATEDALVTVDPSGSDIVVLIAAYRGTGPDGLTFVGGCLFGPPTVTFRAKAGLTYQIQVGNSSLTNPGLLELSLSSSPCPVEGCVEMLMKIEGADCDDANEPTECDVPVGDEFVLSVEAVAVPPEGYILMQTYVHFGDTLTYKPEARAIDEILWVDCDPSIAVRHQADNTLPPPGESSEVVGHACITGLFPPLPVSNYAGDLVAFTLTCSQQASSSEVRLLTGNEQAHTPAGTSGSLFTTFVNEFREAKVIPMVSDLTVNCVGSPAVGGISLDSDLRTLPLKTTNSDSPPWGVAVGAAAGFFALGGAAWYARRR